jgi:hypothetical protein
VIVHPFVVCIANQLSPVFLTRFFFIIILKNEILFNCSQLSARRGDLPLFHY